MFNKEVVLVRPVYFVFINVTNFVYVNISGDLKGSSSRYRNFQMRATGDTGIPNDIYVNIFSPTVYK